MQQSKIDKKDKLRALLTDTYPGDVPVMFSNDGLYINSHLNELKDIILPPIVVSFFNKIMETGSSQSSPYKYSIKKNEISLRTLSLIHPRSQFKFCEFYNDYSSVIVYLCSKSEASIRAPSKISNSLFLKDPYEKSKYKEINIDTLGDELSRKHASSFFSYRRHNRLYKLFDSPEYIALEKRYPVMWMLDISNCFDSIYTHTISWSVKNKEFIKSHIDYRNQFCNLFDQLMQRSNNNETNGIPIGSEVSRVFAEIILQSIDCNIINAVSDIYGYSFNDEYLFLRYVDDYVLFSKNEKISKRVSSLVSDNLSDYNLYINDSKLKKYVRPFNTEKSSIITQTKNIIQELESRLFEKKEICGKSILRPNKINNRDSLIKHFINQIKYICSIESRGYVDVSSYLVSTLSNKIIRLVDGESICMNGGITDEDEIDKIRLRYRESIIVILDLMFFFYTVSPQVQSSYKLSKTIIILDKFFLEKYNEFLDNFRGRVMKGIADLTFDTVDNGERARFVSLESLNILISTSDFGGNYLIPEKELIPFVDSDRRPSYFVIISLLYYIKDHEIYDYIRNKIEEIIYENICNGGKIDSDSESAHLMLDSLSCPFLSHSSRSKILNLYLSSYDDSIDAAEPDVNQYLQDLESTYWFVKWNDLNLIKLLERKELNNVY